MSSSVSATEAARSFSEILNRVNYRGESFVVERGGTAVCRIIPAGPARCTVSDLIQVLRTAPKPDDAYLDIVEDLGKRQPKLPKDPWGR